MSASTHAGRVAVVTGAARGFGRAISEGLAARGADIVVVDILDCAKTAQTVRSLGRQALTLRADVTDPDAVNAVGERVRNHFGRCDILVNNAGAYPFRGFADVDYEFWRKVLTLNLDSQFLMTKALVDLMAQQQWGRIINLTSNSLALTAPALTAYMAAKAGVIGFTRGLANDLAPDGITVNAVGPTATNTEGAASSGADPGMLDVVVSMQAIKRPATTDDIVGTVAFLSSDDAAFVTGQTIMADGGLARL
jgi:NAD(P)-dependent dehydrogenase (short-subunit alcohol dehydrogenase family)